MKKIIVAHIATEATKIRGNPLWSQHDLDRGQPPE